MTGSTRGLMSRATSVPSIPAVTPKSPPTWYGLTCPTRVLIDGRVGVVVIDNDKRDIVDACDLVGRSSSSVEPLSVRITRGISWPNRA